MPPIHLLRMTAAALRAAIGRWKPVSIGDRPGTKHKLFGEVLCVLSHMIAARCPLIEQAKFHVDILVADGAPSNNMMKKAEAVSRQKTHHRLGKRRMSHGYMVNSRF